MRKMVFGAALAAMTLTAISVQAAGSAADKCEASKNKTVGAYYSCREKAEATAITKATTPDYSKCTAKFDDKWDGAETQGAGECPDIVLTAPMNAFIAAQAADAALVVAGAPVPDCAGDLATCEGDLTTCEADLADCVASLGVLKTGQTMCYDTTGSEIPCAGTGQDGELLLGVARSFTDNGDGTITDDLTGLMWEKLSDDGSINDTNNAYTWENAFAVKVATLNSGAFAGYTDWRVPNRFELETLLNLGAVTPATYSAFNNGCVAACTVLTCSCTGSEHYWSSSTYLFPGFLHHAWRQNFSDGTTGSTSKTTLLRVRAVRGG